MPLPSSANGQPPYNAAIYVRLSKGDEDKEKEESDSIKNQKDLVLHYLKACPDIAVRSVRVDDGYSGVTFTRPAFTAMMADVAAGLINCIVVKDFSRFGRNYIEAGRYIQILFPKAGVRFIAVNDHYDSAADNADGYTDHMMVAFKNMINDAYAADISVKIRSQLDIKRKQGAFIGSFAIYGYLKSTEDKNKLIPDEAAAGVVRDIFRWKLDGFSQQGIADRLNAQGVLSPMEYKNAMGLRFYTSFKKGAQALWSATAVGRILQNEVYTGVLEQRKWIAPNYKLKKRVAQPKDAWIRVEKTHEPIVSAELFSAVRSLLAMDTRVAVKDQPVYLFAGFLVCGDCKQNMIRKTVVRRDKQYHYYACSTNRDDKTACASHSISEARLTEAVIFSFQIQTAQLQKQQGFAPFSRRAVVTFIEEIAVYQGGRIRLSFRFNGDFPQ